MELRNSHVGTASAKACTNSTTVSHQARRNDRHRRNGLIITDTGDSP